MSERERQRQREWCYGAMVHSHAPVVDAVEVASNVATLPRCNDE